MVTVIPTADVLMLYCPPSARGQFCRTQYAVRLCDWKSATDSQRNTLGRPPALMASIAALVTLFAISVKINLSEFAKEKANGYLCVVKVCEVAQMSRQPLFVPR